MKRPPTRPRRPRPLAARVALAMAIAAAAHGASASDAAAKVDASGSRSGAIDAGAPAGDRDARAWVERRQWLGSLRWWADPAHAERLRSLARAGVVVRVEWAVPADADDGITPAEREVLCGAKSIALRSGAGVEAEAGSPAPTATDPGPVAAADGCAGGGTLAGVPVRADGTPVPGYGLRARVTDAWRPYRLLNLLLVALPGPSAPFMTQGGAASEIEVVDDAGRAVAGFECRGYAGIAQFAHAFGRIGHTRAALRECARAFHATLRDGRLPGDAPGAGGPPAADPSLVN